MTTGMIEGDAADARERILAAALDLVTRGGVAALTTRAVAVAAGVQAPTLYRLFGDKGGLLDAVAERGLAQWIAQKQAAVPLPDPVEDLRASWQGYVAFGLAHPAVFTIMTAAARDRPPPPAASAGIAVLRARVSRLARAGRLRVPEERAVALIHAVGTGVVQTLLSLPPAERHDGVAELALRAVEAVLLDAPGTDNKTAALAVGLLAHLPASDGLTPGERLILAELLTRLAVSERPNDRDR
ncbi:transcriptional regulator, TetR family [Sphingomonas guangdongensis]|uniref:Transcriptional regulator, TetR family n=1 Tax=Sphingomonas guangdongensis TaxID=1141890 RepID=A0A285QCB9_9SPHN|nr:transcriptional regulator, TetR family [Sphingomonas guangdongensis]